jgi:hypothetical protein
VHLYDSIEVLFHWLALPLFLGWQGNDRLFKIWIKITTLPTTDIFLPNVNIATDIFLPNVNIATDI